MGGIYEKGNEVGSRSWTEPCVVGVSFLVGKEREESTDSIGLRGSRIYHTMTHCLERAYTRCRRCAPTFASDSFPIFYALLLMHCCGRTCLTSFHASHAFTRTFFVLFSLTHSRVLVGDLPYTNLAFRSLSKTMSMSSFFSNKTHLARSLSTRPFWFFRLICMSIISSCRLVRRAVL
jgi:hypothetical protein